MVVYKITNKINKKQYIGQTVQPLSVRWSQHIQKNSCCRYLRHAIQTYGKENFEISSVCRCSSIEQLNHVEALCIRLFNSLAPNGYNLTTGGNNRIVSEETKQKMSKSQKGIKKPQTPEHVEKIAKTKRGRKQSPEHIKKRVKNRIHTKHSLETIEKIKKANLGKRRTEETKRKISQTRKLLHLSPPNKKHTPESLRAEALKYKTKSEFVKYNKGAYFAAWKMDILDDVCGHMPENVNKNKKPCNFKWTCELLKQEALKYETRNEFYKNSGSAYVISKRLGVYEEITKHMSRYSNSGTED